MLFVSTNLYHRHVCPLSCFKCVCVLCKVLLALSFHPQDIFYFCSLLFLSIFLVFPHFVRNTLKEFFSFMLNLNLVLYRSSTGREQKISSQDKTHSSVVAGTMWKIYVLTGRLNPHSSYSVESTRNKNIRILNLFCDRST